MAYITTKNGSRQLMFLITTGTLLLFSTITVLLRFYCRFAYIRNVGLDDYFMVAALAVAVGMGIMNSFHVSLGTGRHGADLDLTKVLVPTLKHWYAYQMVYPWALFFVKASILALYNRIFKQTNFRYAVYLVAAFVSVYTIVTFFVNAFECRSNVSQAWSPTFPQGCNNLPATYFSTASISIMTDVVVLLMPVRVFWQLNMHRKKRLALLGVFLVGGIAVVASIVRLYALWVYTVTSDVSYDAIYILLLSQIEVNVAIISASAPALRPLFSKTFLSSSYNQDNAYSASYGANGNSAYAFSSNEAASSNRQVELSLYNKHEISSKHKPSKRRSTRNTSQESILGDDGSGITKTTDVRVDIEQEDRGRL